MASYTSSGWQTYTFTGINGVDGNYKAKVTFKMGFRRYTNGTYRAYLNKGTVNFQNNGGVSGPSGPWNTTTSWRLRIEVGGQALTDTVYYIPYSAGQNSWQTAEAYYDNVGYTTDQMKNITTSTGGIVVLPGEAVKCYFGSNPSFTLYHGAIRHYTQLTLSDGPSTVPTLADPNPAPPPAPPATPLYVVPPFFSAFQFSSNQTVRDPVHFMCTGGSISGGTSSYKFLYRFCISVGQYSSQVSDTYSSYVTGIIPSAYTGIGDTLSGGGTLTAWCNCYVVDQATGAFVYTGRDGVSPALYTDTSYSTVYRYVTVQPLYAPGPGYEFPTAYVQWDTSDHTDTGTFTMGFQGGYIVSMPGYSFDYTYCAKLSSDDLYTTYWDRQPNTSISRTPQAMGFTSTSSFTIAFKLYVMIKWGSTGMYAYKATEHTLLVTGAPTPPPIDQWYKMPTRLSISSSATYSGCFTATATGAQMSGYSSAYSFFYHFSFGTGTGTSYTHDISGYEDSAGGVYSSVFPELAAGGTLRAKCVCNFVGQRNDVIDTVTLYASVTIQSAAPPAPSVPSRSMNAWPTTFKAGPSGAWTQAPIGSPYVTVSDLSTSYGQQLNFYPSGYSSRSYSATVGASTSSYTYYFSSNPSNWGNGSVAMLSLQNYDSYGSSTQITTTLGTLSFAAVPPPAGMKLEYAAPTPYWDGEICEGQTTNLVITTPSISSGSGKAVSYIEIVYEYSNGTSETFSLPTSKKQAMSWTLAKIKSIGDVGATIAIKARSVLQCTNASYASQTLYSSWLYYDWTSNSGKTSVGTPVTVTSPPWVYRSPAIPGQPPLGGSAFKRIRGASIRKPGGSFADIEPSDVLLLQS